MKDTDYRTALIQNPKETIEQEIGIRFPETLEIRVLEETPVDFFLVLPAQQDLQMPPPLTDQELNQVSGGNQGGTFDGCVNHTVDNYACMVTIRWRRGCE